MGSEWQSRSWNQVYLSSKPMLFLYIVWCIYSSLLIQNSRQMFCSGEQNDFKVITLVCVSTKGSIKNHLIYSHFSL